MALVAMFASHISALAKANSNSIKEPIFISAPIPLRNPQAKKASMITGITHVMRRHCTTARTA
ncbi:hypothetical protein D3C84_1272140 [compost metagenome]